VPVGFPSVYFSSTVFVSGLFICPSTLTTVVWTHDINTSSLYFLKFWGCDMLWPILAMISDKGKCHPTTGHEGQRGSGFIAHLSLTLALDWGRWSRLRHRRFTPGEETHPSIQWVPGLFPRG
jgi:hypothetical protein